MMGKLQMDTFTEYKCMNLEKITKVTGNVTLNRFCNFLF